MGFLIFDDAFSRTGGIGSNYRETGLVNFECTGTRLQLPETATAYQYTGGTGYYAAAARAIANAADPKTYLPISSFRSDRAVSPINKVRYQVRLRMPDVLPSPSDELWAGLVFLAADQANQGGYELLYWIDDSGNHSLRVGTRSGNGTWTEHAPGRRDLSAASKDLAAGEEATLFAEVVFANMWVFDIVTWFQADGGAEDERHLWRGVSFPTPPTFAIPPGSPTGYGPDSIEFYGGVIAYQEGPATSTTASGVLLPGLVVPGVSRPPLLTSHVTFDEFRVRDNRAFEGELLNPIPVVSAPATYSSVSVPSEGNSSGGTLTVQPSYSVPVDEPWKTRELRHEDGTVESFATRSRPRRVWQLAWNAMPKRDRDTLRALLVSAEGTVKDFDWTDPETGEDITLRAVTPPAFDQVGGLHWTCQGTFEEVLS